MTQTTAKLTLKVGSKEIELEASPEVVRDELARLADRMLRTGEPAVLSVTSPRTGGAGAKTTFEPDSQAKEIGPQRAAVVPSVILATSDTEAEELAAAALDPSEIAQLYAANTAGELSLRGLPDQDAEGRTDALLLLLYGLLMLKGESPVTAPSLLRSARASGLTIHRAHRLLDRRARLIHTHGRRRGKRYRLSRAGVRHCETLIRAMLQGPSIDPIP